MPSWSSHWHFPSFDCPTTSSPANLDRPIHELEASLDTKLLCATWYSYSCKSPSIGQPVNASKNLGEDWAARDRMRKEWPSCDSRLPPELWRYHQYWITMLVKRRDCSIRDVRIYEWYRWRDSILVRRGEGDEDYILWMGIEVTVLVLLHFSCPSLNIN